MRHLRLCIPAALACCAFAAMPASAQDDSSTQEADAGPLTVSGNVDLVSDYRFRGISFSDEDIAIQGGITVTHESGFYVGTWGSSLEDSPTYGHTEVDLYAGYGTEVAEGTALDVGLLYYYYPNGDDAFGDSDYFEPYISLSHTIGPVEAKVGAAYAWSQDAIGGEDNIYLYGNLGASIPNTPISLSGHLGYSDGSLAPGGNYLDWSLGASYSWDPLTFGIAYVDTDLPDVPGQDGAVVFSVSAGF